MILTQSTTVTTPSSFNVLSAPSSAHNDAIIGPGFATPINLKNINISIILTKLKSKVKLN